MLHHSAHAKPLGALAQVIKVCGVLFRANVDTMQQDPRLTLFVTTLHAKKRTAIWESLPTSQSSTKPKHKGRRSSSSKMFQNLPCNHCRTIPQSQYFWAKTTKNNQLSKTTTTKTKAKWETKKSVRKCQLSLKTEETCSFKYSIWNTQVWTKKQNHQTKYVSQQQFWTQQAIQNDKKTHQKTSWQSKILPTLRLLERHCQSVYWPL